MFKIFTNQFCKCRINLYKNRRCVFRKHYTVSRAGYFARVPVSWFFKVCTWHPPLVSLTFTQTCQLRLKYKKIDFSIALIESEFYL